MGKSGRRVGSRAYGSPIEANKRRKESLGHLSRAIPGSGVLTAGLRLIRQRHPRDSGMRRGLGHDGTLAYREMGGAISRIYFAASGNGSEDHRRPRCAGLCASLSVMGGLGMRPTSQRGWVRPSVLKVIFSGFGAVQDVRCRGIGASCYTLRRCRVVLTAAFMGLSFRSRRIAVFTLFVMRCGAKFRDRGIVIWGK